MDEDLLTLLRTSKVFASLPSRTLRKILPHFEKVELEKNEVLYYQGDPSDSIEIVLEGRLVAILTTATGENKIVGEIEPGETTGEISAISGEPRTITVKAVKDSILFKLSSDIFVDLCHQFPTVLFEVLNPIISRSQQVIQIVSSEKFKKHVVMMPANEEVNLEKFSQNFAALVEGLNSVIFISDYNEEIANATGEQIQAIITLAKDKNVKKLKQKFIFLINKPDSSLAKFCCDQAESFYIIGEKSAPMFLNNAALDKIENFKKCKKTLPEFILLHNQSKQLSHNTAGWLKLAEFGLHYHVRADDNKDYRRLLRFIRGKAVGLVLSGGGTRGWGHIGAIKALLEAGIPIDAVGGTSVGSIIAASFAMTESYEGVLDQFNEVIENSRWTVSWGNLTWPAISIFNARGLTTVIKKIFDDIHIEDLWIPYFCISTNLSKNCENVHQSGLLWEKIRCSVSIPGIIPPMVLNGELQFDGGLLNNLPVDIMRKIVGQRGNIVAVELAGNNKDEHKYNFPPVLTFWQTLMSKLKLGSTYKFPRFIDTFLKSLLVGSSLKSQLNGLAANILVTLDLSAFPMLHSNKKLENRIIDIGYNTTMQQLKNMERKAKAGAEV